MLVAIKKQADATENGAEEKALESCPSSHRKGALTEMETG